MKRSLIVVLALSLLAAACSDMPSSTAPQGDGLGDPGDCEVIDTAVSSEKIALFQDLAASFNDSSDAKIGKDCVFVRPYSKASGGAATLLSQGWPDEASNGPKPEVWSPASSAWAIAASSWLRRAASSRAWSGPEPG